MRDQNTSVEGQLTKVVNDSMSNNPCDYCMYCNYCMYVESFCNGGPLRWKEDVNVIVG